MNECQTEAVVAETGEGVLTRHDEQQQLPRREGGSEVSWVDWW